MKWHKDNGQLNFWPIYWTYYLVIILPLLVAKFFTSESVDEVLNIIQLVAWIPILGLIIWNFSIEARNNKRLNKIWDEEMKIMRDFGWSGDPKKVKRLEELKEERKKLQ